MRVLPMLDVSSFTPPPRLVAAISAYCAAEHGRANELLGIAVPFESEEGQGVLAEMVAAHWSDLTDLAALVRDIVALEPACLVLRGLGYNQYPETVRDSLVLALTQSIGKPTDHNLDKRVLWPVKPRAEAVRRMVDYKTTFSEEAGEAPLHSDSAFAPAPEKYNCLFVVRQATAGGGSVVLNVPHLVEDLERKPDGRDCLAILRGEQFPFRVPDAFFKGDRVITAPVLGERPYVRFRGDCLAAGFAIREDLRSNERLWAIEHFRVAAESSEHRLSYRLQPDEAIVLDNHTMLHARTDFADQNRHLIRVRMRAA